MSPLLLWVSLALAEPDPSIAPPPPAVHPVEVSDPVDASGDLVREGDTGTVRREAEPSTPAPRGGLLKRAVMWLYFLLGDGLLWLSGLLFIPAHQDIGAGAIFATFMTGLIAEARLWLDRKRRSTSPKGLNGMLPADFLAEDNIRRIADKAVADQVKRIENMHAREIKRRDDHTEVLKNALQGDLRALLVDIRSTLDGQTPGADR